MLNTLQVNDELYKYRLLQKIGGGNFGQVWLAKDLTVEADVAVKILDDSFEPVVKHLQEAKFGHHVKHINVVRVHYADVIAHKGVNLVIIAMDHHPQGSVINELNSSNYLDIKRATAVIIDILKGLEYLHENGIYHNDIKPSNILIGHHKQALLTDYGISTASTDLSPQVAPNSYKLHTAPETLVDDFISVQTDIYQIGLTYFRLINGIGTIRAEMTSKGAKAFNKAKEEESLVVKNSFLPFVPLAVKQIILIALKSNPRERYQSALEMRRALERLALYGYWNIDVTGAEVGHLNQYCYRYSHLKKGQIIEFTPYKKSSVGRETRIKSRVVRCNNEKHFEQVKGKFMQDVVLGNI